MRGYDDARCRQVAQLLVALRSFLKKDESTSSVGIEIVHMECEQDVYSWPILGKDTAIVSNWTAHEEHILRILEETDYLGLVVVRRGISDVEKARPCIVIASPSANSEDWWNDKSGIVLRLENYIIQHSLEFNVEVLQWSTLLQTLRDDGDAALESMDVAAYLSRVMMGSSIGIKGGKGAGTVGAPVRMEFQGAHGLTGTHEFGLTTNHVILDESIEKRKSTSCGPLK